MYFKMNQLMQFVFYEIKLYLRNKNFWLIGTLVLMTAFHPGFNVLLIQFVVIYIVARDEGADFSGILASLPLNTAKLYLARAMAVFGLLMGMWPFMMLNLGLLTQIKPAEWLVNCQNFGFLTLKYITVCMTAIGFVFLASLLTRRSWKLYLIIGTCWVIGAFLASNLSYFPSWSMLLLFGHGEMGIMAPSAAVGFFSHQNLLPFLTIFQIIVAILLILLVATYQIIKRRERTQLLKLAAPVSILIMVASCAGFIICREIARRESGFRLGLQEAKRPETVVAKAEAAVPRLESYDLQIKLRTYSHFLEGKAILTLKRTKIQSDILFFTLRNCFTVADVKEASGQKLEWRRDGTHLMIRLLERRQGEVSTLVISYSGQVWEWFAGYSAHPTGPLNFVAPTFSLLRSGYAWYPVPGVHSLYLSEYYDKPWGGPTGVTLWAKRAKHSPVRFTLTVDIDTDSTVVSNLERTGVEMLNGKYKQRYRFGSLQGRDVFLLTGPYHYEKRKFPGREDLVEVYCYRQHQARISKVLNSMAEPYLFYQDIFQPERLINSSTTRLAKMCTVVEIPSFFFFCEDAPHADNLILTNTVLVTEDCFRTDKRDLSILANSETIGMRDVMRDIAILQCWGQSDAINQYSSGVISGLGFYLHALHLEKTSGRAYVQKYLLIESIEGIPVFQDVFMTLADIRSKHGDGSVGKIVDDLYQVYQRKGSIDPETFLKIVEPVLLKADWTPEKKEEIRQRLKSIAGYIDETKPYKIRSKFPVMLYPFNREWF
jgi:hypothetical protein